MTRESSEPKLIRLPDPEPSAAMSAAEAIARRRSRRAFAARDLSRGQLAGLCWAAQGITDPRQGFRAAPSAGALFPMTVFVVGREGVFEYEPGPHALRAARPGDVRRELRALALDQSYVATAPICLVVAMDVKRTASKYGIDAERYCLLEAGHIAQNVLIQATAMGLGAVPVGAFDVEEVAALLGLPRRLEPVYLIPVGHLRGERMDPAG
jgi:SagB-type dehydrogenase family enzyme